MAPSSFGSACSPSATVPPSPRSPSCCSRRCWCRCSTWLSPPIPPLHVPTYVVSLLGKYLAFALLALSVDLIWGYCGILSLGHGAFFALGGYAMGMHLMREIGGARRLRQPELPDFMVFLNWRELPWYWQGFDSFPFAVLMVMLAPGLLAFVFGWFAFRSRVTGVYLSIITQALTFALMLAFFRNDMGFGGNNGLTDFKDVLGFDLQADTHACRAVRADGDQPRRRLPALPVHRRVAPRQGADLDPRRGEPGAFPRLPGRVLQAVRLRRLGGDGGDRRRALRAAGRHHQSLRVRARQLHRDRHLGGDRRARHPARRHPRRGPGQLPEDLVHRRHPGAVAVRAGRPVHRRRRCSCRRASSACSIGLPATAAENVGRGRWRRCRRGSRRNDDLDPTSPARPSGTARHHPLPGRRLGQLRRLQGAERSEPLRESRRPAGDHRPERRRQDDDDGRGHRQDQARRRRGLLQRRRRPDQAGRGAHRQSRHRPQVPEADGVREPYRARQPGAGGGRRSRRLRLRCSSGCRASSATASTRCCGSSRSAASATGWPARCRTGRSSGWRSACC